MHIPVGIRSLAISLPSIIRTNDYYREKYPEIIANAEEKNMAKLMSLAGSYPRNAWEVAMQPYLEDPFRGTLQRLIIAENESSLTLEYRAAKDALKSANLSINDIDLLIVSSFLPEQIGFGNAAYLAHQLGLKCGAWNLDASCASSSIALQTACSLVQSGRYRHILVAFSSTYSRFVDEEDTLSWFFSDGGGAFIVSELEVNQGILGSKTINTSVLCDQIIFQSLQDKHGKTKLRMQLAKDFNRVMGETATEILRTCCEGAVSAANLTLNDIDFFIFPTPTAWFTDFCIQVLNINPNLIINLYSDYANMGGALSMLNLYHAAKTGKIRENDVILVYSFGAASSASASVMRWGDVRVAK